jgi:serine/threonine-protein kinase RsbW
MKTNTSSTSLRVTARLENLATIRRFVEETVTALDVSPDAVADIVLAVDEVVSNIVVHGYRGQPGPIEIEVKHGRGTLAICIRDEAFPFNPTSVPPPDLTLPLEQRTIGGIGIHLIRQVMEKVIHRITPQGGNELLLVKGLEENSEDFDIGN